LKNYTFIGAIETGESIYFCPTDKAIAIEKDHQYLVEPTPKEMNKIYNQFPELKSQITGGEK
jgi:hypothetical protein